MASVPLGNTLQQLHRLFGQGTLVGLTDAQLLGRFLDHRDGSAFAALVQRHGPMVLGTCRAVLRDPDDAEDAFQASFLILVRKARSIQGGESLGGWLHRVAHRVAIQANAEAARRRARERRAGTLASATVTSDLPGDDLRPVLHAEIQRLPEKYRLPVVLCDLEGLTRDEAAGRLRWTEGMVRGRLARARRLLKSRLVRRGLEPASFLVAVPFGRIAVPQSWAVATARAASRLAESGGSQGIATVTVARLVRGVLKSTSVARLKTWTALALTVSALIGGAIAIQAKGGGDPAPDKTVAPTQAAPDRAKSSAVATAQIDPGEPIVFHGRVLAPDGTGYEGARLFVVTNGQRTDSHREARKVMAISGADGRFRFEVPRGDFDNVFSATPWQRAMVLAVAEGHGFALCQGPKADEELVLGLVADDVPIEGRILDLQGGPVAGVTVRVLAVKAPATGDLTAWRNALESRRSGYDVEQAFLPLRWFGAEDVAVMPPIVTGADGRFRLSGIGRERLATLAISGPTIETAVVNAMTRPGKIIRVPGYRYPGADDNVTYVGSTFEHVAGPTRPIEGTVRDRASGRPLAGIVVQSEQPLGGSPLLHVQTTTDEQGRYRLVGLPKGREGHVMALPSADQDYIRSREQLSGDAGADAWNHDIALTRGVRLTGRIVDKATGRPVRARVEYFVFVDNPHLDDALGFQWAMHPGVQTDAEGNFRLVALPGPGVVAARGFDDRYLMGIGADAIPDEDGNGILDTHPYNAIPTNYHAIAAIGPAPNAASVTCNLAFDPGRTLEGSIEGPDGSPLSGALLSGLSDMNYWENTPGETARFTLTGLRPGKPRFLQFLHPGKKLAGWLEVPADATDSPRVRLEPWGVVSGRLVDDDGQPRSNVALVFGGGRKGGPRHGYLRGNGAGMSGRIVPDNDGRFRVEGLAPGLPYSLQVEEKEARRGGWVIRDLVVKPGEVRNLGDVRAQPEPDR